MNNSLLAQLELLGKLKKDGILTDAEFEKQKAALLANDESTVSSPIATKTAPAQLVEKNVEPINVTYVDKPTPRWAKWLVGSIVVLFFIGLINQCNEDQKVTSQTDTSTPAISSDTTTSTAISETPPKPVENWSYYDDTDKMGSKYFTASATANDLLEFDFPYNGGSTATITVRKKGGSTDMFLQVSKGQFITDVTDGGTARFRFDDGKPVTYTTSGAADYSSDIVFFDSPKTLIAKMKKAKKMVVEVKFYNEGTRQIEFNVAGLKWNR